MSKFRCFSEYKTVRFSAPPSDADLNAHGDDGKLCAVYQHDGAWFCVFRRDLVEG